MLESHTLSHRLELTVAEHRKESNLLGDPELPGRSERRIRMLLQPIPGLLGREGVSFDKELTRSPVTQEIS
jgi:hypothetical protein